MRQQLTQGSVVARQHRRRNPFWNFLLRNKMAAVGAIFLILLGIVMISYPWLPLPSATKIDLLSPLAPASPQHLLGTDENGRDILARLIAGGRISMLVGLSAALLTVLLGTTIGLTAGFYGGLVDRVIMRFTDGILSIPVFFLLLAIVALWGSSTGLLVLALALTRWMGSARLVRSEVMRYKTLDYVLAAQGLGASNSRIMWRHLMPQVVPTLIVATTIGIGNVMLLEAGLSFLGLGIQPPQPSWGNMLTASQNYVFSAPHLAIYPGLMILLTVMAFNSIGDVVRDALDPRLRTQA